MSDASQEKDFKVQEDGIGDGGEFVGWTDDLKAAPTQRRKGKSKRVSEYKAALNMNSLMDIVTIILVYLLKSFAGSPVSVPDPNVKLPASTAQLIPEEAATITVTTQRIVVNDKSVAEINEGRIDPNDKRDGPQGFFITPLYDALVEAADNEKKIAQYNPARTFKGISIVICDKSIPFRLLSEVMYTAGQAEFGNFKFAVIKKE
ncbi:MAG: biopolymer transporter ExbD [Pseudomonadota bacterium]